MIFTILDADFTFNLQIDSNGRLTSITATKGNPVTTYKCSIQVENENNPLEMFCCGPSGCTVGPCVIG
jgi:hypothetical protein